LDEQPQDRKNLSDHLANERTFLAWVRTSITFVALGFVVAKFGILLREIGREDTPVFTVRGGAVVGVALVIAGLLCGVLATLRFDRLRRQIERSRVEYSPTLDLLMGALVALVSLVLAVYLIVTI
jgi:putative membrane protein